ncbi:hypothetical protein DTO271D3_1647 [Paecilomyces variotii]|nr:hypothetical protein DTO207G8_1671 [Paecilomyces variotii]KAJ9317942.1 hypothetical protein DTO271D3_1647 [Paecilomyces variotii]
MRWEVSFLFSALFFLIAVNAQYGDDACPAPEPEGPTYPAVPPPSMKPSHPPSHPHPHPKPTRTPMPTPSPGAPCTPCIPSTTTEISTITDTATETTTITEPPETITTTATETTTATVTTEVPVTCMDTPPADYDLGTCPNTAPRIRGTYSVLFAGTYYIYGDLSKLMNAICDRMENSCHAPESSVERCRAAEAAANQFTGDEAVAVWNEIMAPCVHQPAVRRLRGRSGRDQGVGSLKTEETITGVDHVALSEEQLRDHDYVVKLDI